MFRKYQCGIVLGVLVSVFATGSSSLAEEASAARAQGVARSQLNLVGFVGQCIDSKLLDKRYEKFARFGGYMGGFVLGTLYGNPEAMAPTVNSYAKEGASGRVHEFDAEGNLKAYNIEFSAENCATLAKPLETMFNQFSQAVLVD